MWAVPLALAGAGIGAAAAVSENRRRRFRGKVVLITGGSRGLGLALARQFASNGCRIAICARHEETLERARQTLAGEGAEVFATPCDVADRHRVERMVETVRGHYGRIDVLIANAGVIRVAPLENSAIKDFEHAMGTMFWGVVYPTLAVLPEMRARGEGHIAVVTSVGGKVAVPHLLPYSCAKFAAVGFCEGLRTEVARQGIKVTTVVPWLMRTGSYRHADFGGRPAQEAGWFGFGSSVPLLTMSAEAAARKIACAIRAGKAERQLGSYTVFASAIHGAWPSLMIDVMSQANRLLPDPADGHRTQEGVAVEDELPEWWKKATAMGRHAGLRLNQ